MSDEEGGTWGTAAPVADPAPAQAGLIRKRQSPRGDVSAPWRGLLQRSLLCPTLTKQPVYSRADATNAALPRRRLISAARRLILLQIFGSSKHSNGRFHKTRVSIKVSTKVSTKVSIGLNQWLILSNQPRLRDNQMIVINESIQPGKMLKRSGRAAVAPDVTC